MEHRAPWPWAPSARCVLERAAVAPAHSTYHARSVSAAAERPVRPGARRRSLAALLLGVSAVLSRRPSAARAKLLRSSREVARSKLEDGSEVVKLASGVQYVDRRVGRGEVPQMGDVVLAHVKGYLMEKDDPVFIDTYSDGAPLVFSLGTMTQGITEGLEEALATMTLGSVRLVQVPSYMGYPNGLARVGVKPPLRRPIPREGLRYEVELLRCVPAPKENGGDPSQRLCCSDPEYPCKVPPKLRLDVITDGS
ncbi:unnamed protein product [Durusdinium trenchii]|uniref:peptidylprolyl isomerase n=1 Tax=Durusdinium trenchii TaxID=1381693 RepID=A0ABP0NZP4_9DINO